MGFLGKGKLSREETKWLCNRGIAFYTGKGQEQNYKQALRCFLSAAESGNDVAQYYLGIMYECGEGTKKNLKKAIHWYCRSGDSGNIKAQQAAIDLYGGALNDQKKLNSWLKKSAENGNVNAMITYGKRCRDNLAAIGDNSGEAAIKYFEMSKTLEGRFYIALLYLFETCSDIPMDKAKGCKMLEDVCRRNCSVTKKAQLIYNEQLPLIEKTAEIQSNLTMAKLLQQKAWVGDIEAKESLLTIYYPKLAAVTRTDCGFDRMEFFLDAAMNGDLAAAHWYGGQLLKKGDLTGGIRWLEMSAEGGNTVSTEKLLRIYSGDPEFNYPKNEKKLQYIAQLYKKQLKDLRKESVTI